MYKDRTIILRVTLIKTPPYPQKMA